MNYISLGYFCSVALELEKIGLRSHSSPFDWLISDFEGVLLAIQNHFSDFLNETLLAQCTSNRAHYKNEKYNFKFFHDFNEYDTLQTQLPSVQEKYERRIQRFYKSISEPTVFIRYISDEQKTDGISKELLWIEKNYPFIIQTLKSFNEHNEIIFIANDGVSSEKIQIYNVSKDENDSVARNPFSKNTALANYFNNISTPDKQMNIARYVNKQKGKKRAAFKRKICSFYKKIFLKEYIHSKQY
ncbi:MAG: hypothetical protein E7268_03525 [Lachnospiraceae bacterium]|nr:hypothetical protein [Lachnospiraceae bacterium]